MLQWQSALEARNSNLLHCQIHPCDLVLGVRNPIWIFETEYCHGHEWLAEGVRRPRRINNGAASGNSNSRCWTWMSYSSSSPLNLHRIPSAPDNITDQVFMLGNQESFSASTDRIFPQQNDTQASIRHWS